jgi:hypothetical protein
MTMDLKVLKCGNCEEVKLGVHGLALGLAALCGLYNSAAWLSRREPHLAVNAVLYTALTIFEQRHVVHHMAEIRRPHDDAPRDDIDTATTETTAMPDTSRAAA